jgi:acyl-homoserine lactone acylase PvdQ
MVDIILGAITRAKSCDLSIMAARPLSRPRAMRARAVIAVPAAKVSWQRLSSGLTCARVALSTGGERGDRASPHFLDKAARYARGLLGPVYFWPKELKGHITAVYHPGE